MNVSCVCGVLDGRPEEPPSSSAGVGTVDIVEDPATRSFEESPDEPQQEVAASIVFGSFMLQNNSGQTREREIRPRCLSVPKNTTWFVVHLASSPSSLRASTLLRALFMGRTPRQKAENMGRKTTRKAFKDI